MKKFFTFILIVFVIGYLATQVISFINSRYAVPEYIDEYTKRIEQFAENYNIKEAFEELKNLRKELEEESQAEEPTVDTEEYTMLNEPQNNEQLNQNDANISTSSIVSPVYYNYHLLLDDSQKELYLYLLENVIKGKWTISTTLAPHLEISEVYQAADSVVSDHPELFWLSYFITVEKWDDTTVVYYTPYAYWNMTVDPSIYTVPFVEKVEELTAKTLSKNSDEKRIKFVHDHMVRNITYDTPSVSESVDYVLYNPNSRYAFTGSAYGALVDGLAICAGYAKGFQIVLQNAGYTAGYVAGNVVEGAHAWNRVFANNQVLYYDTTFDDYGDVYLYPFDLSHDYYGLTESEMEQTHIPYEYFN